MDDNNEVVALTEILEISEFWGEFLKNQVFQTKARFYSAALLGAW